MQQFATPAVDLPSMVPAACIPTNNLLSGPLNPVIGLFTGAFGNLLQGLSILMTVVLVFLAIALIFRKDASKFLRLAGLAIILPIVAILAIAVQNAIFVGVNNAVTCA